MTTRSIFSASSSLTLSTVALIAVWTVVMSSILWRELVTVNTMRAKGIVTRGTAFQRGVVHVVSLRPQHEMIRIDAGRRVASMKHERSWHSAVDDLVTDTMGVGVLPVPA